MATSDGTEDGTENLADCETAKLDNARKKEAMKPLENQGFFSVLKENRALHNPTS